MPRKKILWLVSWYPNRNDKFDGDFVQRHAKAAAIHNDIHVLFVTALEGLSDEEIIDDTNYSTGLTEQIVYFKKPQGILQKLRKKMRWLRIYKKLAHQYIQQHGKPDLVHVHIPWKAGVIALCIKKKFRIPFVVTEHWGIYNDIVDDNYNTRSFTFKRIVKQIFEESMFFTTVSKFVGKGIQQVVTDKSYSIIPNVVDTSLFFYKEKQLAQPFTFLHVSNMVPLKNVEGILNAFHKLISFGANARLILIGNREQTFVKKAEELGLLNKTVFFKGEIPYREVAEAMQEANCFVLNSTIENSPCVISEALCCGLPVITTNVGGISEMIEETNGLFVPVKDDDSLAIAMKKMMDCNADFNPKMIAFNAAKKYSYSRVSEQFDGAYKSATSEIFHRIPER